MTKFKPGDNAWFFTFPEDGCGGFDIDSIELHVKHDLSQPEINYGGYLDFSYKSKIQAINAILERIDKIARDNK